MKELLIWWTNQADAERITKEQIEALPEYIQSEFDSRVGRAGRGRLWVHESIDLSGIEWNEKSPFSNYCLESGGIVFRKEDLLKVRDLPGQCTDLQMMPCC
jgi:hypothetical protein